MHPLVTACCCLLASQMQSHGCLKILPECLEIFWSGEWKDKRFFSNSHKKQWGGLCVATAFCCRINWPKVHKTFLSDEELEAGLYITMLEGPLDFGFVLHWILKGLLSLVALVPPNQKTLLPHFSNSLQAGRCMEGGAVPYGVTWCVPMEEQALCEVAWPYPDTKSGTISADRGCKQICLYLVP